MPAFAATSEYDRGSDITTHSQIANIFARHEFRKSGNYPDEVVTQYAYMSDESDKNGGPNHLRAWMRFSNVKGAELATRLGGAVTPGMVSDLANSKRALSAKWLRRIAPILGTTPGMLLDHDPYEIDRDIMETWLKASPTQRKQLVDMSKVVVPVASPEEAAKTGS